MGPSIEDLERQEAELLFSRFDQQTAIELGGALLKAAAAREAAVTIDIRRGDHLLFHAAMPGTTPDNDQWVRRKSNVVQRFHRSSLRMGLQLQRDESTLQGRYGVDPADFAAHGGSFPITVRGVGVIGAVTVSGLPQVEDHQLVVSVLQDFLSS
jgi:uncharacterized protein (UPF0303 family)